MPFKFRRCAIPDVKVIEPPYFGDERGFFSETYKYSEFGFNGIDLAFIQDNQSGSRQGVLRGLHYQINPAAQGKLVRVLKGAIYDVAVDIRRDSPYCGRWVAETLSRDNRLMLWIPPGFAHGFVTLEDDTEVLYKTTDEYAPEYERGIIWNDPAIGISWPLDNPIVSEKDRSLPLFMDAENNFVYEEMR